jgi:hypothetical protein
LLYDTSQPLTEASHYQARTILESIQRLNIQAAASFGLRVADEALVPFRLLLELQKPNGVGQAQSVSFYIAVSYCWHSVAWKPIPQYEQFQDESLPDTFWPISRLMMQVIIQMRASGNEGIWIDAVCIDQEDEEEKQRAIASVDVTVDAEGLATHREQDRCRKKEAEIYPEVARATSPTMSPASSAMIEELK